MIAKFGGVVSGGGAAWNHLRTRLRGSKEGAETARVEALERAMEIQAALNKSVEVQIKLVHAMVAKQQKKLQMITVALIATAVVAALALAAAWLR